MVLLFFLGDSTKKDTPVYTTFKDLPLKPSREISFNTKEGTWISVDVSPDGNTIAFDLMGDIYTMPITGGKATPVTKGFAYETHPRFSPMVKNYCLQVIEVVAIIFGSWICKSRIPYNSPKPE